MVAFLGTEVGLLFGVRSFNPSGTGGGIENDPHQGFSSVIFARGMISKRNLANQTLFISGYGGGGVIIEIKTLPKILAGMAGNLLLNIVFKSFCYIFRLEGLFQDTKVEWIVPVCFRDKLEKLPLKPREDWVFSSFSPIFLLFLPTIWLTHPHKNYIF